MAMTGTKSMFKSLTINASTVAIGVSLLQVFGVNVLPDVVPHLNAVIAGVASAFAIYGRIRAKTLIA